MEEISRLSPTLDNRDDYVPVQTTHLDELLIDVKVMRLGMPVR